MPYLGSTPNASFSSRTKQDFTANGSTTTFTLSSAVASANDIEVFVGNVRQEPTDAYTVNGTALTMSAAPANGLNFYVVFKGLEENSVVPADNTISSAKIASGAVTTAKLDTNIAISGNLDVGTIRSASGNSALTVDSSGDVTFTNRYPKVALLADVKSANTAGGTFTAGDWYTRDLNTEVYDPDGITSLSNNQFTLQPGTYIIEWSCVFFDVGLSNTRLYDQTGSAAVGTGMSMYGNPPDNGYGICNGSCQVTPTVASTYKVQHRCGSTKASTGFGLASNMGINERYVEVKITQLK